MADHSLRIPVDDKSRFLPGMPFEIPCGPEEYEDSAFLRPKIDDIGLILLNSTEKRRLQRSTQFFMIHSELCLRTVKGRIPSKSFDDESRFVLGGYSSFLL